VITKDVAPDTLAVGRGRQENKAGWAAQFRAKMRESKGAKPGG
jgi:bifunctional UDP-N-acetylglucosamine pyrophosphorylase/glucosamine-1-phosphate N-acetyltransferase